MTGYVEIYGRKWKIDQVYHANHWAGGCEERSIVLASTGTNLVRYIIESEVEGRAGTTVLESIWSGKFKHLEANCREGKRPVWSAV